MDDNETVSTLSFTVDDSGNVLELTRITLEGGFFYRDNGTWVELDATADYPTIYEQTMLDVMPEEQATALEFWDSAQSTDTPVSRENVISFTALVH